MKETTPEQFMEYFRKNYPGPDTIIMRPDWHAPKIYRAAIAASAHADLLEACKDAFSWLESLEIGLEITDPLRKIRERFHAPHKAKLQAAIAKAEGEL